MGQFGKVMPISTIQMVLQTQICKPSAINFLKITNNTPDHTPLLIATLKLTMVESSSSNDALPTSPYENNPQGPLHVARLMAEEMQNNKFPIAITGAKLDGHFILYKRILSYNPTPPTLPYALHVELTPKQPYVPPALLKQNLQIIGFKIIFTKYISTR